MKRRDSRYSVSGKFEGVELPSFPTRKKAVAFGGPVNNISDGGFCMLAPHPPKPSILLQGQLKLAHIPARIPALVQVRWVHRLPHGKNYRIGLKYVI